VVISVLAAPAWAEGPVCGVRDIIGTPSAPVQGDHKECGIDQPVDITEIANVKLSAPAKLNCKTAKALRRWISEVADPKLGNKGGLESMTVAASYSCRTRNNKKDAKLSEHAFGNAIDISGFTLKNGKTISIKEHWRSARYGQTLQSMHENACGIFKTVLGPRADKYHQDHFHLDVSDRKGKPYCR